MISSIIIIIIIGIVLYMIFYPNSYVDDEVIEAKNAIDEAAKEAKKEIDEFVVNAKRDIDISSRENNTIPFRNIDEEYSLQ